MKTKFKIAWVDDNLSDEQMTINQDRLARKLSRKNKFSMEVDDIYARSDEGKFDDILNEIVKEVDSSNCIDLAMVDYELGQITDANGELLTGPEIAKRFRDSLPTLDIIFYSGKKSPSDLRNIMAKENVDCVSCIDRGTLVDDAALIVEKILHRAYKISTLRGLILNSVCEIDHLIIEILDDHYSNAGAPQKTAFCEDVTSYIVSNRPRNLQTSEKASLLLLDLKELLKNKRITSGSLFRYVRDIRGDLNLDATSTSLFDSYWNDILELRNTAAHAKEAMCETTGQAMLKNGAISYRHQDIDGICKLIVAHELNFNSILQGLK
ncbi:MAG: hypothetical protein ABJH45_06205 [Paracoccaceae bacterium]